MLWDMNGHTCCIYTLCDGEGNCVTHLLGTVEGREDIHASALNALGYHLYEVARGELALEYIHRFSLSLTLCDAFWTCGCEACFIHHRDLGCCPLCGIDEDTRRCGTMDSLLRCLELRAAAHFIRGRN